MKYKNGKFEKGRFYGLKIVDYKKIKKLKAINKELLEACKEMYIELLAYQDKHQGLKSATMEKWNKSISKAEGAICTA